MTLKDELNGTVRLVMEVAPQAAIGATVEDTSRVSGLGRSTIYNMLESGDLKAVKIGGRTIILMDSVRSMFANAEPYRPDPKTRAATAARKRQRAEQAA